VHSANWILNQPFAPHGRIVCRSRGPSAAAAGWLVALNNRPASLINQDAINTQTRT